MTQLRIIPLTSENPSKKAKLPFDLVVKGTNLYLNSSGRKYKDVEELPKFKKLSAPTVKKIKEKYIKEMRKKINTATMIHHYPEDRSIDYGQIAFDYNEFDAIKSGKVILVECIAIKKLYLMLVDPYRKIVFDPLANAMNEIIQEDIVDEIFFKRRKVKPEVDEWTKLTHLEYAKLYNDIMFKIIKYCGILVYEINKNYPLDKCINYALDLAFSLKRNENPDLKVFF